jgi:hypothetical protein
MKKLAALLVLICSPAWASDTVYQKTFDAPMAVTYEHVYEQLEASRFFVVFEPNIGKNLAGFSDRWGDNYNRNGLTGIRSMVFCNAWYANAVGNADPAMLSLCPMHVTLTEKDNRTTVLFARPTVIAIDSPAAGIAREIEEGVITALDKPIEAPDQANN